MSGNNTTMHDAWARVQHRLPYALTTPESLWFRPDGVVYFDGYPRYKIRSTGDGYRIGGVDSQVDTPLTDEFREVIVADAFALLKEQSGLACEQADKCIAPGPLNGEHKLCWFGPSLEHTWGSILTDLDKARTFNEALKETQDSLSNLAIEHAFVDLRKTLQVWIADKVRHGTDNLWLSDMNLDEEATLDLVEDDSGATRFMLYLTAGRDGSARVRFLDDGDMNYMHFRAGTAPNGLGEGYSDVVQAIRAALDRI